MITSKRCLRQLQVDSNYLFVFNNNLTLQWIKFTYFPNGQTIQITQTVAVTNVVQIVEDDYVDNRLRAYGAKQENSTTINLRRTGYLHEDFNATWTLYTIGY